MSNTWDRVVNAAACTTLSQLGESLVNAGAWTALTGVGAKPAFAAIGVGSLSNLAAAALCPETSVGASAPPNGVTGCYVMEPGGFGQVQARPPTTGNWGEVDNFNSSRDATRITRTSLTYNVQLGKWVWYIEWERIDGSSSSSTNIRFLNESDAVRCQFRIFPLQGSCATSPGDPTPLPPGYDTPVVVTDPETNCTYNVSLQGFMRPTADQLARPVYIVESANQTRADGGRIVGGCNFEPTIVVGGGGDGGNNPPIDPIPVPLPAPGPGPNGEPWWLDLVKGALGGVAAGLTEELLDQLLEDPLPEGDRTIYAACEYKQDGSKESFTVNYPEESYNNRVLTALDAIVDFQQQILYWKTPTCGGTSQKIGDYRTISFISDEQSPNGKSRVAKRFRYRSSSGVDLGGVVDHWKDFVWQAGPVVVQHQGTQLGTPQVWAISIDEGKRVIRHAAAEAGIDVDSTGQWTVGGSDAARYGVPGTMRVNTKGGYYWITSRLGPDQRPPVAET